MSDTPWDPEEVRRERILEVLEDHAALLPQEMCFFNFGLTCDQVKSNGSGHCCHEYDLPS